MTNQNTIILKGIIEGVASRKDKTLRITFGTQELKDGSQLFSLQNEMVNIGINRLDISEEDIDLIAANKFGIEDVPNKKSQSKRLRDVIYVLGKQHGEADSEAFYKRKMEQIIEFYKSKLG